MGMTALNRRRYAASLLRAIDEVFVDWWEAQQTIKLLVGAIEGLKRGDCWCGVAIDDPNLQGRHTLACQTARTAIEWAQAAQSKFGPPPYAEVADGRMQAEAGAAEEKEAARLRLDILRSDLKSWGCWCELFDPMTSTVHSKACVAATKLYARLEAIAAGSKPEGGA